MLVSSLPQGQGNSSSCCCEARAETLRGQRAGRMRRQQWHPRLTSCHAASKAIHHQPEAAAVKDTNKHGQAHAGLAASRLSTLTAAPHAPMLRLHGDMDIGQAITAMAQAAGRSPGSAEEQLVRVWCRLSSCANRQTLLLAFRTLIVGVVYPSFPYLAHPQTERLRSNWYSTAADVAAMTQVSQGSSLVLAFAQGRFPRCQFCQAGKPPPLHVQDQFPRCTEMHTTKLWPLDLTDVACC